MRRRPQLPEGPTPGILDIWIKQSRPRFITFKHRPSPSWPHVPGDTPENHVGGRRGISNGATATVRIPKILLVVLVVRPQLQILRPPAPHLRTLRYLRAVGLTGQAQVTRDCPPLHNKLLLQGIF